MRELAATSIWLDKEITSKSPDNTSYDRLKETIISRFSCPGRNGFNNFSLQLDSGTVPPSTCEHFHKLHRRSLSRKPLVIKSNSHTRKLLSVIDKCKSSMEPTSKGEAMDAWKPQSGNQAAESPPTNINYLLRKLMLRPTLGPLIPAVLLSALGSQSVLIVCLTALKPFTFQPKPSYTRRSVFCSLPPSWFCSLTNFRASSPFSLLQTPRRA